MGLVEQFLKQRQRDGTSASDDGEAILVEITTRRNRIEKRLRSILKDGLRFAKGGKAAAAVLDVLSDKRRLQIAQYSYDQLWEHLYFDELRAITEKHWDAFQKWFAAQKADVTQRLDHINKSRADAHARELSEDDLAYLRVCFKRIEEHLGL